jgi:alginate O-acetyltransferase complex protein AlgI
MVLVVSGWILFRSESFAQAAGYFRAMVRLGDFRTMRWFQLDAVASKESWVAILIGILAATPLARRLADRVLVRTSEEAWSPSPAGAVVFLGLLVLSAMSLANSSFNPFIYYRF